MLNTPLQTILVVLVDWIMRQQLGVLEFFTLENLREHPTAADGLRGARRRIRPPRCPVWDGTMPQSGTLCGRFIVCELQSWHENRNQKELQAWPIDRSLISV